MSDIFFIKSLSENTNHIIYSLIFMLFIGCIITLVIKMILLRKDKSNKDNTKDYDERIFLIKEENTISNMDDFDKQELQEFKERMNLFLLNYCRASNNITINNEHKPSPLKISKEKIVYQVNYEFIDFELRQKEVIDSVLTITHLNKKEKVYSLLDNYSYKEDLIRLISTLKHENIKPFLHFELLYSQGIFVKIQSNSKNNNLRKLVSNKKGLPISSLSFYSSQILSALAYLHSQRFYLLSLETENVLLSHSNKVEIINIENIFFNRSLNLKPYDYLILGNSGITLDNDNIRLIHESSVNLFEKIDIASFGRVIYELHFGKELTSGHPCKREIEEIQSNDLREVFKAIYPFKNGYMNQDYVDYPEVTAESLLEKNFFRKNKINFPVIEENKTPSHSDVDILDLGKDFFHYSVFKEYLFNQKQFISKQIKRINKDSLIFQ